MRPRFVSVIFFKRGSVGNNFFLSLVLRFLDLLITQSTFDYLKIYVEKIQRILVICW